jgi:exodeoxyribonuclease V alpha subunit
MSDLTVELRVTSIRSRGKNGGAIFAGITENGDRFVAVCDYRLIPDPSLLDQGQIWSVAGNSSARESIAENGFKIKETQITATTAQLLRPAGRNIIAWIADCSDAAGVGQVKARKLYERFGPSLIELIEQKNITALAEVIKQESAELLCQAFEKHAVASTLLWLDQIGMPRRIGASALAFYKNQAREKIEANPYILLSFEADWAKVDDLARNRMGVAENDPRRLLAGIEEALYRGLNAGHTCLPRHEVKTRLTVLLGTNELADQALAEGLSGGQFLQVGDYYQLHGSHLMESYIARRLMEILAGESAEGKKGLFNQGGRDLSCLGKVIDTFEIAHRITLSPEQRAAVLTSAGANLSLILGGAGTGKTTVLKALFAAIDALEPGTKIIQLALAGLAAQRMTAATGRESMTIAGFLAKVDPDTLDFGTTIVVDEASMIDVILLYRLLRHMPAWVRLILVGDPSQLPPIGPGLVLHSLAGLVSIPQTELTAVMRQTAESGIPKVAAAIRDHKVPHWTQYGGNEDAGVSFLSCTRSNMAETVKSVYAELGGDGSDFSVQILSVTNGDVAGVKNLNSILHDQYESGSEQVFCFDQEYGVAAARTLDHVPINVGDLVMFTQNDYALGLRNGSLGKITAALPVAEAEGPCCAVDFDGIEYKLTTRQMQSLVHSYSITVHKAQGSQFARIIVPIKRTRLLDQSLIYTAVTRGVEQVVLVGDENVALAAIKEPATATRRYTTLPALLCKTQICPEESQEDRGINGGDPRSGEGSVYAAKAS